VLAEAVRRAGIAAPLLVAALAPGSDSLGPPPPPTDASADYVIRSVERLI